MSVPEEMDFAKALKELEEIVKLLESGELSLEESLANSRKNRVGQAVESILDRGGGWKRSSPAQRSPACPRTQAPEVSLMPFTSHGSIVESGVTRT